MKITRRSLFAAFAGVPASRWIPKRKPAVMSLFPPGFFNLNPMLKNIAECGVSFEGGTYLHQPFRYPGDLETNCEVGRGYWSKFLKENEIPRTDLSGPSRGDGRPTAESRETA